MQSSVHAQQPFELAAGIFEMGPPESHLSPFAMDSGAAETEEVISADTFDDADMNLELLIARTNAVHFTYRQRTESETSLSSLDTETTQLASSRRAVPAKKRSTVSFDESRNVTHLVYSSHGYDRRPYSESESEEAKERERRSMQTRKAMFDPMEFMQGC